jgi:DNA polymerase I-like protein with 3'-5' exonuclease and polymerase domains
MKILFFDIETNGIEDFTNLSDLKVCHCISIYDPIASKMITFEGNGIKEGLKMLAKADKIIGHNIIGFDLPALAKLYNFHPPLVRVQDSLVMSRCLHPDLREDDFKRKDFDPAMVGSHSLKAWGHRMGEMLKLTYGENEDAWDSYNEEMKKYCERDVLVTKTLYEYLTKLEPSKKMLAIEHWFAYIIRLQESQGFAFDVDKAEQLEQKLNAVRAKLQDELQEMFEPTVNKMKTPKGYSLEIKHMDGVEVINAPTKVELKKILKSRGMVQNLVNKAEPLDVKEEIIPFNPGSRKQIKERLEALGFEIPLSNDGKTVKIDESTLKGINHPSAKLLLGYLLVVKRLGQLAEGKNGWLRLVKDGRIHGRVNTNGAVTGRCTHSLPNLAQVPATRAEYGEECRSLFITKKGYKLVGCDASGLELRMLAHYLSTWDGGEYSKAILEGDIHSVNQKAAGLKTRDQAKTFIYGFLYGAGDAKIGEIVEGTAQDGSRLKKRFLSNLPALKILKQLIKEKAEQNGCLTGLDGRILPIRSEHAALNMLLQSAGAVLMKVALIKLHTKLTDIGWQHGREYAFVGNIHDEFQAEVKPELVETYGELAVKAIQAAGRELNMKCPMDGEYKVGKSWAETH